MRGRNVYISVAPKACASGHVPRARHPTGRCSQASGLNGNSTNRWTSFDPQAAGQALAEGELLLVGCEIAAFAEELDVMLGGACRRQSFQRQLAHVGADVSIP